jgi:hypothetical protein
LHALPASAILLPGERSDWRAHDADSVASMEDVLEVYRRPSDPVCPVLCMDEQPNQLIRETRVKIPVAPGRPGGWTMKLHKT